MRIAVDQDKLIKELTSLMEQFEEGGGEVTETPFLHTTFIPFADEMKAKYSPDMGAYLAARYLRFILQEKEMTD